MPLAWGGHVLKPLLSNDFLPTVDRTPWTWQEMSLMRRVLQYVLAAAFLLSGANKITDVVHAETHEFLSKEALKWGPIWNPIFQDTFKQLSIDKAASDQLTSTLLDDGSKTYKVFMRNIGIVELVCAATLLLDIFSSLGAFVLALTMAGAAYTHNVMKDNGAAVPGVLCSLLVISLLLPSGAAKPKKTVVDASSKKK